MAEHFGAGFAGVRRLVPTITIPETSETVPSQVDVQVWVVEYAGAVARRLGALDALTDAATAQVHAAAAGLVHLAVAATVYDAHFPERAGVTDQSYGAVLWDRYNTGLDALVAEVEEMLGDVDETDEDPSGGPAFSFPDPYFVDDFVT